jgi:PAS domain S-box-containing protein
MSTPRGHDEYYALSPVEAQARLAAIVESSDDAIVSKNLDGIIQSWNGGAQRIFGWSAEEVIGKPITIIIPPDRMDEEPQILRRLRSGERVDHFQTVRMTKDGRQVDVSVTISPIRDEAGRIVAASKVARDVTEVKRIEGEKAKLLEREKAARLAAEHASRMKDDFLATLSHELRTPLNAILGYAQLLRAGAIEPDELRETVAIIERNARSQAQIIEDLLDLSRIVSGKIRLDVQRVDPATVVTAAIDSLRPSAEMKGVRVTAVLDPLVGPIKGDPARLQQVIWNLINNAIKFTPKGGTIQVALERVNSHMEIVVSDSGEGIKPDFLPLVFDRFRQADASTTRRHGGLGIGLSIVKQLVELHGGTVRAKSGGSGQGSTFIVALPLSVAIVDESEAVRAHPKAAVPTSDTCDDIDLGGVGVLVVDDEADSRHLVARILQSCGAHVRAVASYGEAMKALEEALPQVIVSDLGMPEHDGYDLIRDIRALSAAAGGLVPAVALSAFARWEDRRRAVMAGFQTHIAKPLEPGELLAVVASLAGRVGRGKK